MSGGKIEGKRAANIDFPEPGGPTISRACNVRIAGFWALSLQARQLERLSGRTIHRRGSGWNLTMDSAMKLASLSGDVQQPSVSGYKPWSKLDPRGV